MSQADLSDKGIDEKLGQDWSRCEHRGPRRPGTLGIFPFIPESSRLSERAVLKHSTGEYEYREINLKSIASAGILGSQRHV